MNRAEHRYNQRSMRSAEPQKMVFGPSSREGSGLRALVGLPFSSAVFLWRKVTVES